ncbi:MAG TPA: DMT family transporter [Anaeromyxobacter sp.]|nr:DMT family transporter [Anaeromyxobacter sp.]
MSRRGWILFASLALIWGLPYMLIRVAVAELSPALLVLGRTAIGASLLLPFVVRRGHLGRLLPRWRPILAFTVVEVAVPWFLLSHAERRLSSSAAGLLVACVPLAGALVSRLTGRVEAGLGPRGLAGLCLGLAGVAALVGLDFRAGDAWAVGAMLVVVLGYAVGPIVVSRYLADLPSLEVVAVSLAAAALLYAPAAVLAAPAAWPSGRALAAVAVLGVACTAAAFVIFFQLIAEVGPLRATLVAYLNPAVAVAAGVLVLDEPFTAGTGAGFVLILSGSYLAAVRPRTAAEVSPPEAP